MSFAVAVAPRTVGRQPARLLAGAMAIGVHAGFAILLFFGLTWQIEEPAPVMVEMWQSLPPPPKNPPRAEPVKPAPEVKPEPAVKPLPEPDVRDAEIALDKQRETERKRAAEARLAEEAEQKAAKKLAELKAAELKLAEQKKTDAAKLADAQKREAARRKVEDNARKLAQALADEEQRQLDAENTALDKLRQDAAAAKAAAARAAAASGAINDFRGRISAKVRGNTRVPDNLTGNPEVRYRVRLLPTGDVVSVTLVKSSGNAAYDLAVERAIEKSSPLPLPPERDARAAFVPELLFVHRPLD